MDQSLLSLLLSVCQMEHCDRGCLRAAISRGMFRSSERYGRSTALRALVRTAKEVAQVHGGQAADKLVPGEECSRDG